MNQKHFFAILNLSIGLTLSSCIPQSLKEQREVTKTALQENTQISTPRYLETDEFRLHYRGVGTASLGMAVWVHGTPGSWDDGIHLMVDEEFTSGVELIGIDRPGWGESQYFESPRLVTSFEESAELIALLLAQLKAENPEMPVILIGHSWGGSLVPAIALKYPQLVDGVIIAAGGLDPDLTAPRWYNRLGNTWVANAVIGDSMKAANVEVYALQEQLDMYKLLWKDLAVPVVAIQGDDDALVDPSNLDFIAAYFTRPHILRLPNQGHLLQAERSDLLGRCIKALLVKNMDECRE